MKCNYCNFLLDNNFKTLRFQYEKRFHSSNRIYGHWENHSW